MISTFAVLELSFIVYWSIRAHFELLFADLVPYYKTELSIELGINPSLRRTKIIAQPCCTKVIQKLVQPFLKKIVPLAQKIWIIWIRLLKCPWKMASAFKITRAVSKICLKHPVIFVWVLNWIFFIFFWFLLCLVNLI